MAMCTRRLLDTPVLEIEPYTFEHVRTFTCLGTILTKHNNITEEVQNRIAIANRCYFSLQKHFESNFISRIKKILLYKTLVHPIVLYGTECWTLSQMNEEIVNVCEWKIL
jgi:hypothetical protein